MFHLYCMLPVIHSFYFFFFQECWMASLFLGMKYHQVYTQETMLLRGQLRYMRSSHILVRLQIKRRRQSPSASANCLGAVWIWRHSIWDSTQCKGFRRSTGHRFSYYSILVIQIWPSFIYVHVWWGLSAFLPGPAITCYARQLLFDMWQSCIVDCTRHAS